MYEQLVAAVLFGVLGGLWTFYVLMSFALARKRAVGRLKGLGRMSGFLAPIAAGVAERTYPDAFLNQPGMTDEQRAALLKPMDWKRTVGRLENNLAAAKPKYRDGIEKMLRVARVHAKAAQGLGQMSAKSRVFGGRPMSRLEHVLLTASQVSAIATLIAVIGLVVLVLA